jgi:poly-D-alanine transfer protein DltD
MSIPYRHDLVENARTNLAIKKLNKKLKNITQRFRHVTIINSDVNRIYFTRHGMHLNNRGKVKLAKEIANLINKSYLE